MTKMEGYIIVFVNLAFHLPIMIVLECG